MKIHILTPCASVLSPAALLSRAGSYSYDGVVTVVQQQRVI